MSIWNRIVVVLICSGVVVGAIYRFVFAFTPYWVDIVIICFLLAVFIITGVTLVFMFAVKKHEKALR